MNVQQMLQRIDTKKAEMDRKRPLSPEEIHELQNYHRIGLTYSSNALEGNSLTLCETKILIEDGLTVGGKPILDCTEATGHAKAYDYMLKQKAGHHTPHFARRLCSPPPCGYSSI